MKQHVNNMVSADIQYNSIINTSIKVDLHRLGQGYVPKELHVSHEVTTALRCSEVGYADDEPLERGSPSMNDTSEV